MEQKINKMVIGIFFVIVILFIAIVLIILHFKSKLVSIDDVISNIELSVGSKVPSINEFFNKKNIKGTLTLYYDDWLVENDILNDVGSYRVVISVDDKIYNSTITVKDDIAPSLKLRDLTITVGEKYEPISFVLDCKDNSNRKCTFKFSDDTMQNYTDKGTYDISIIAIDEALNEIEKSVRLTISEDSGIVNDKVINNGIDTKIEVNTKEENKYGVKVIKEESVFYEIDTDGKKTRIRSKVSSYVDRDGYNATIDDLYDGALKQIDLNKQVIRSVLDIINEYRRKENVSLLNLSNQLNEASTVRALEIGWSGKFSHTRPNGKNCYSVSQDLGYEISILGENIAKDYDSYEDVLSYWKSSLGSYKNIVNSNYKYVGVGFTEVDGVCYWVLLFS